MDDGIPEGYRMTELGALPEGWEVKTLSDLLLIIRNGTTETQVQKKTDYPVTRIETISNWSIDYSKVGFIESEKVAKTFKLLKYDILLSHINSIKHIGKVALYLEEKPLYHGMNLMLLRPNLDNNLDPVFLFKYLTTEYCKKYFESRAKPAINQASLSQKEITDVLVILPPLPEQRRIAEILSTVDDTIERTETLIEKYRNIKSGLMADLLTRGIDEEGRIRSEETHRFKDSALGRVPEEWEVGTLSDIADVNPRNKISHLSDNSLVTFLTMSDVGENGKILLRQFRKLTDVKNGFTCFAENDVLFAKITPCMENGKGALATELINKIGFGSTEFHILRANKFGLPEYIYHITRFEELRLKAEGYMTGSAGQQRVPKDFFYNYYIPIPPLPEQRRIAEVLTAVDQRIEKEEAYRDKLLQIKKGLMQDLLTGRVRVKVPQEAVA